MSTEAVVASADEDLANAYQTLTWIGNQISFWTENHVFIRLRYDDDDTMTFLDSGKKKMEYAQLIKELQCKNQKVYIEWVQETGKYLYYDLLETAQKVKNVTFNLSVFKYDSNDDTCIEPKFDESTSPEKVLTGDDIVLLSPQRSFQLQYTPMGEYHGNHILYLGPLPSKEFIKQCYVKSLINCCAYSNDKDILALPDVKEYLFDVAGWTVGRIADDSSDDDDDDDDEAKENDNDNDDNTDDQKIIYLNHAADDEEKSEKILDSFKQLQLKYLDEKIDLIDILLKKGNVLIHCLAGAHRSPFITGCYEYKYGKLNGKTPKEIYEWLTTTREIVQPLGYDRWMADYFAFLEKNKK